MVLHVNYEEVKSRLPELIEAAKRGDKIIITQDGKQVVQIMPVKSARVKAPERANRGIDTPDGFSVVIYQRSWFIEKRHLTLV